MAPAQCRAARALLQWSQNDLAHKAGVNAVTLRNYENEKTTAQRASIGVMRQALEAAGVIFTEGTMEFEPGVALSRALRAPLARSWLVARREDLKLTAVLATVALDRMTDGLVFVSLVPVAVLATVFPDPTGDIRAGLIWGAGGSLVLFVLLFVGFELLRRQTTDPGPLIRRLRERVPTRVAGLAQRLTTSFAQGINWPHAPSDIICIVFASIGIKLFAALQLIPAGLAFGVTLRPAEYLFVMVFLGFLVILGHFLRLAGGFIIAAVFALRLFGVPEEEALAIALVIQAVNILSVAAVGAAALWAQGVVLSETRAASIGSDNIALDRHERAL